MKLFALLREIVSTFYNHRIEAAEEAWKNSDWLNLGLNIFLMVAVPIITITVPLFLIYRFRHTIMAILTPVFMVALLIASFFENNKGNRSGEPPAPPLPIEEVRTRAQNTYPLMKQTAYLLLRDLCRYLPGLVAPFSLAAVVAPVNYDITASLVTVFHFVVAKGADDTPVTTIKEILESLVDQYLRSQTLPLAVPAIYTAADGTTWPGLVVDGVYDIGQHYRVDFVLTNEAEVARLKARAVSNLDSHAMDIQSACDPDFE